MTEPQPDSQARANKLEQGVLRPVRHSTMPDPESQVRAAEKAPFPSRMNSGTTESSGSDRPTGLGSQAARHRLPSPHPALSPAPKVTQQELGEDFQLI